MAQAVSPSFRDSGYQLLSSGPLFIMNNCIYSVSGVSQGWRQASSSPGHFFFAMGIAVVIQKECGVALSC